MTRARTVAAAIVLSLALHGGLALALRALGVGASEPLPPLFVDLVAPVVAVSAPRSLDRPAPPPVAPARRDAPVPARSAAAPSPAAEPIAAAPAAPPAEPPPPPEAPPAVPSPPPAAPPETLAPPPPPSPVPAAPREVPIPVPPPLAAASPAPPVPAVPAGEPSAPAGRPDPVPVPAPLAAALPAESSSSPVPRAARVEQGGGPVGLPSPAPGVTASGEHVPAGSPAVPAGARATAPVPRDGVPAAQSAGDAGGQRGPPPDATAAGSTGSTGSTAPSLAALPGPRAGAIPPEYDGYVRALRQRIQERLAYPWRAVRQRLGGTIELELSLDGAGRLAAVIVVGPDGPGVLREAAMRAVRDATPFPFPPGLTARPLTIRLPVVFELR